MKYRKNNKMKKLIWIVLLLFCGCNQEEAYESFDAFPEETNLKHQLIEIPPVLFQPLHILFLEGALVVVDLKGDHFFHVFSTPDFEYSGSYVRRGHGPGEEVFINPFVHRINETRFFYQSYNFINTITYEAASGSLEVTESLELTGNLIEFQSMFPLGSAFIAINSSDEFLKELMMYDPAEGTTVAFGPPAPDYGRRLSAAQQKMISGKWFSVKLDHTRFAALYGNFPILRIYAADGSVLKETRYNNHQPFPEIAGAETNVNNYCYITSTNQYIYGLYIGKTDAELPDTSDLSHFIDYSGEIHVWDWEGNPIRKILLDQQVFSIAVSPDDKVLIGSSVNNLDYLYRYEL